MSLVDFNPHPPDPATPARFSVSQFDAMINAGVFSDEQGKVQLFRGEILFMTPPNPPHDDVVCLLTAWAFAVLSNVNEQLEVRVQLSMDLTEQASVVSPDLMLCYREVLCESSTNGRRHTFIGRGFRFFVEVRSRCQTRVVCRSRALSNIGSSIFLIDRSLSIEILPMDGTAPSRALTSTKRYSRL